MKKTIYLDHFATTPLDPQVFETMKPYFTECFGNAHSLFHSYGWQAAEAVDKARQQVGVLIGAKDNEIFFTSGATESNNLAIKSVAQLFAGQESHIITVATEHKSVLNSVRLLEEQGFRVSVLPVGNNGLINLEQLNATIDGQTKLISIMFANNEIGVIQPIQEIGCIARAAGVIFHCDATQAVGKVPVDVNENKIDLLTFSAHKIYGPKGVGALYVKRQGALANLPPQIDGGGQEQGLRSGTLNVPGIVGLGEACAMACLLMQEESMRLKELRDYLQERITSALDHVVVNANNDSRLPNLLSMSFAGVDGEKLIQSMKRVAVSSGSTCSASSTKTSHVLEAIGVGDEMARSTLRFGLGRFNTREDIDFAAETLISVLNRLRSNTCFIG
jgi:cysteine desulfurase